jgi:IS605 OrfB family transposase
MEAVKTLKLRIKDKHAGVLSLMAREVNQVWNCCNETSSRAIRERGKWLSGFDLQKLTAGYAKCEGVQIAVVGHKFSTGLVARNAAIFVGNVQAKAMVKTKMAKSTLDAVWSMLKTMLEYKSHGAGTVFEEVNEAYTTQTCSRCGVIPASSPKGRTGLRMRRWTCCDCGAEHHR